MYTVIIKKQVKAVKNFVCFLLVLSPVLILYHSAIELHSKKIVKVETSPTVQLNTRDQNLFTCSDIFEIGKSSKNMSSFMKRAVRIISNRKDRKIFVPNAFYEVVGYDSPKMVREVGDGSGLGGTNLTLAKEWRFEQSKGQLAHLSCRLKHYKAEDVSVCARRLNQARDLTVIAYVGDSRVRQHVEVLLDLLRNLEPRITTYQGEVITVEEFLGDKGTRNWKKYKHDFRTEFVRAPGLVVDFHWAALINQPGITNDTQDIVKIGAWDLLQRWLQAPARDLPNLIILNTGAWQLMDIHPTLLKQIDQAAISVMVTLRPLLARLATRTTVVWSLPDPFKEYISHDYNPRSGPYTQQTNSILEWMTNSQLSVQPPGVLVWDSFLPVSWAAYSDCVNIYAANITLTGHLLPDYSTFKSIFAWHCSERMHVGFEALSVAVQMMLNHVCNPLVTDPYCCAQSHT